jgi:hypothetical protein
MQTRPLKHASFFPYAPQTPNDTNRAHYLVNPTIYLSLLIANCLLNGGEAQESATTGKCVR